MKITLLVLWGIFYSISAFVFQDPMQDGVIWGENTSSGQMVYVDENNAGGRTNVVLIAEVSDQITFTLHGSSEIQELFDVKLETGENSTLNYITANLLDYEAIRPESFLILYVVEGGDLNTLQILNLFVANLDDESPTLSVSACVMAEETFITVDNSLCAFRVTDPDGWLNLMNFTGIRGTNGEDNLFELKYLTPPADDVYEADVYLVLSSGQTLDYEKATLHAVYVEAMDNAGHLTIPESTIAVIVQVQDLADQPPIWDTNFVSVAIIQEEEPVTMQISATDGDFGINNLIAYTVEDPYGFVSIDENTGLISVQPIDRDAGYDQFNFSVFAHEVEQPDSYITGTITLIIEDKDDNTPFFKNNDGTDLDGIDITINEGSSYLTVDIIVSDMDMGENAVFDVFLKSVGPLDFTSAFSVIPGQGYLETSLTLPILDPTKLDFENPDWRVITMELRTQGTVNVSLWDSLPIKITLNDLNDESPTFSQSEYIVSVKENVLAGTLLAIIQATDPDLFDIETGVYHDLLGTLANDYFAIDRFGGNVTTKVDNVFDHEKQSEVIIDIKATDSNYHSQTAQLIIMVQDVNDEKPIIQPGSFIQIYENLPGTITSSITAFDVDSSPYLEFSINWGNSYATKNAQRVSDEVFQNYRCIEVSTLRNLTNNQTVTAGLTVIATQEGYTTDFEIFDTLYLELVVTDLFTEELNAATDAKTIIISLTDVNDNFPTFPEGTEAVKRSVTENAPDGTVILSPVATDADVIDQLIYSIQGADSNTPNWVTINDITGVITVRMPEGAMLDCDVPPRNSLFYNVTANDGTHETTVTITVDIVDQNDNSPTMSNQTVSIPENLNGETSQNGSVLLILSPEDQDRDLPFHTVLCLFAVGTGPEVTNRFKVIDNTIVVNLVDGNNLDREEFAQYTFDLNCYDDPTQQGPVSNTIIPAPTVTIYLTDINDNYPTISNTFIPGLLFENSTNGTVLNLVGADLDAGDNALINFLGVTEIKRFIDLNDTTPESGTPQNLFQIYTGDNNIGLLTLVVENLSGLFGYLVLTVSLTDLGTPPLAREVDVTIEVVV